MRLLFVVDLAYPDNAGGSHRLYYEVARRLVARGHEVHLITGKVAPDAPYEDIVAGIHYHRLDRDRRNFLTHGRSYIQGARRVFNQLTQQRPFDAISAHYVLPTLGILSALGPNRPPMIYTFHGPWAGEFGVELQWSASQGPRLARLRRQAWITPTLALVRALEWGVLQQSTLVHTLSHAMAQVAALEYRVPATKQVVIPGGVDTEKFTPAPNRDAVRAHLGLPPNRPLLLTVRRLYARMGLENLITAIRTISAQRPDVLLLIGGKGPLQRQLEGLIAEWGLGQQVRLLGFIPDEELPSYYQAADLFVLPTTALEGFGLVTVEALASGTPVMGTPVGGTVEILSGLDPSLLFPSTSPNDMAASILRFLATPHPSREACRTYTLKHYTWDQMVMGLEALFKSPTTPPPLTPGPSQSLG